MEENRLVPFDVHTELTNYMPLPRSILSLDLPKSAVLQYAALLDRGTLSRKNHFADETGWVYVIFSIEEMGMVLGLTETVIKKNQKLLEGAGLIQRRRSKMSRATEIYLRIPEAAVLALEKRKKDTAMCAENAPLRAQKLTPNNIRKQHDLNNNYYQHNEEESL